MRREFGPLVREMERLCGDPGTSGILDVLGNLAAIAVAAAAAIVVGRPVVPVLAVLYIGVRQRHLSNLGHECIHAKLMHTARGNRALGHFIATLLGESFIDYRISHLVHHAKLGTLDDPMFQSYLQRGATPARRTKRSFILWVVVANAVWELPKQAVRTLLAKPADERLAAAALRWALWLTALAGSALLGALDVFVLYWLIPLILVRPVITWLTDLGNHAGVIDEDDVVVQTRGWTSHAVTRHILGGHLDDMFHPIHHWFPRIPWRRMPEAQRILERQYPRWGEVPWCSGFFFRRRATPQLPCVLDDIVTRLNRKALRSAAEWREAIRAE